MNRLTILGAALTALLGVEIQAVAAEPVILPHRAVYALQLVEARDGGTILGAKGRIEFEWAAGCDGWTVKQKTLLIFADAQGNNFDSGWTLNAWESNDGLTYRFSVKRLGTGAPESETRGKAQIDGEGLGGLVTYTKPEERRQTLPEGTLFPTRHSAVLLAGAVGGELLIWRHVFDGTSDEGLLGVNAVITRALTPDAPSSTATPDLRGLRSWQVQMAFFPPDDSNPEPEHEQVLRLYANGVVDELRFDYGDFVLAGNLEKLDMLAAPDCG